MNDKRHDSVLYSLDRTIELFTHTPAAHGSGAAALEALKTARAQVAAAFAREHATSRAVPRRPENQV